MARHRPKHAARRRWTPAAIVETAAVLVLVVGVVAALATGDGGRSGGRQRSTNSSRRSVLRTGRGVPATGGPASDPRSSTSGTPLPSITTGPLLLAPPTPPRAPADAQGPVRTNACRYTGPPKTRPSVVEAPAGAGAAQWVTIAQLAGNCGALSAPFPTSVAETRVVYRSDASHFVVFVVDLADPGAASGLADVECQGPCADQQPLTGVPGTRRLSVSATDGPWELLVQEFR